MVFGNQEPTFSVIGDYDSSIGDVVTEMFEEDGGATFYPAQKMELTIMLARNKDGSPAGQTIGISKARQNGKSYSARFYAIFMADFEHRDVLYSAHHSKTTHAMFKAMCDLFESPEIYPEFAKDVKNISRAKGFEGIYFKDWKDENDRTHKGGCIEFQTRTNSGARGGTYSVIVIDEAQEMTVDEQEGLLPTISASADVKSTDRMPQQIYIGTPPSPTCRGTVFSDMHKKAHSEEKGTTWWMEWAIEGAIDQIQTAEDAIESAYKTNPAMGFRIAEKTILNEYETMTLDGFCRERLGWWTPTTQHELNYAINHSAWAKCMSNEPKPEGKTAYGVKFSADGSAVCLCGCVIGDITRISLIDIKPTGHGIRWLADWLNERYDKASCVVIDGKNGVDVLVERITDTWKVKGSVIRPSAKDVIASTGMLTNAINEQAITWFAGQEILNDSALTSIKRPIAGGWGFGGENSIPIDACALAYFGAKTCKRNPAKKMRIG